MKVSHALVSLVVLSTTTAWAFAPSRPSSLGKSHPLSMASTSSSTSTPSPTSDDTTTTTTTTNASTIPFEKPARVIRDDLPIVYVYDHCPFCVRVRVALGLKNVKHEVRFLANDDVKTPTALIGKKIAPIFQWTEADVCMGESLDIIALVDGDERMGPTGTIAPATGRKDIKEWQGSVRDLLRNLQRPRYVATGLLPEFQQLDGRHAFVQNHPVPGYDKETWKAELDLKEKLTLYAELMAKDPADDIEELNRKLVELDDLLVSDKHASPGGISMDDVDLFSRLRSITIIQGVQWPKKLRSYMDHMSCLSDVPLYDEMAL
uniref:GST N-terminal domain-containing protein n=1 Tax=Amphora coffeiformis TaxID=265554 RepID=A0A7S3LB76_9STRA|mmetsp:Transcript_10440/g.20029  ORF Transcript_10440/g.20029 Transcript_10440/m.20029 type:complete len:319 (+) Transcript_10440:107-1063(+)